MECFICFLGMYLTEDPHHIGLYFNKWVAESTGRWVSKGDAQSHVLQRERNIMYPKGGRDCTMDTTQLKESQCIRDYIVDNYNSANCAKGALSNSNRRANKIIESFYPARQIQAGISPEVSGKLDKNSRLFC